MASEGDSDNLFGSVCRSIFIDKTDCDCPKNLKEKSTNGVSLGRAQTQLLIFILGQG